MNRSIDTSNSNAPSGMDDLNYICEIHNSPIGGICSDLFCKGNSLMCIMCAVDENSCVRKNNHEIITFEEFFKKYNVHLNQKFPKKDLNTFEFLKYLKELQLDKLEKDYLVKIEERSKINESLTSDIKDKIVNNGMKSNLETRTKKINESIIEIDTVENTLTSLNSKGFDLVKEENKTLLKRIEEICLRYSDFSSVKEKLSLLLEDQNVEGVQELTEEKINGYSEFNKNKQKTIFDFTDYQLSQKLIKLMKILLNENKLKEISNKFFNASSITHFYNTKNKEIEADRNAFELKEIEDFNLVLSTIEVSVPNLISRMLKEYSKVDEKEGDKEEVNYSQLKKYISSDKLMESTCVFSYTDKNRFNTSCKQPYNQSDPSLLKFAYTLVNDFQIKNTLMDMICFFTLYDGTDYMAYSSASNCVKLVNFSKNNFSNFMQSTSLPLVNTGVIYKIEHYRSQDGVDMLLSLSSDKTLNKFEFNTSTQTFEPKELLKLKSMAYTFEIAELENVPYIFVAPYNSRIVQYKFAKTFDSPHFFNKSIATYTYSVKAFYNKYTNRHQLVASTHDSILIFDITSGDLCKTLKTNEINWYLSVAIVDIPSEMDYYIISNIQKNVGVFKLSSDKMVRKMNFTSSTLFRGIEMWNEKIVCVGNESFKILVFNIETGQLVTTLSGHSKSVGGTKRYNTKTLGDVLISFSIDGTIKMWTC